MAAVEVIQLDSRLAEFPVAFSTGDTVVNSTNGTLSVVVGEMITTTVNGVDIKKVVAQLDTGIDILPGGTSAAITIAAGQKLYVSKVRSVMGSTVDAVTAVIA